ncbi:MAG TPA: DNA repair protein RadA [Rhodospirillaceae bacterium]|nr:MAG: DNA repair protein RadA [Alphaproteobacteria bacterium GWF2_58_20]HAU28918.1 DNA repair protein RadA [Rhodospirillaceae bacterium]
MSKTLVHFVCQECGASFPKWAGRCEACHAWNTLVEEAAPIAMANKIEKRRIGGNRIELLPLAGASEPAPRMKTGIVELDRALGGGLVEGAAILVGGDPGIGKSTLLLQAAGALAQHKPCIYISGEESVAQVRLRARRLGLGNSAMKLASATSVRDILATLESEGETSLVIIDSIQTMFLDALESAPGSVAQVRASAQELIRHAKQSGCCVVLVGHVTKEGAIAGPRVLEHMVDTVLYFEGDRSHQFRILRAVKNRFGATDEIGVFEMSDAGLREVANPSEMFLAERRSDVAGGAVFAGMEGTRPVLVEIQALVAPSPLGTPRRAVVGWDSSRLAMVLAVLEARCGVQFGMNDIYLSVAGGLKIVEPAADLAVAAALVSALSGVPVPREAVIFGEIGLAGEVRATSQAEARLKEAAKLGFTRAFVPRALRSRGKTARENGGMMVSELGLLVDLLPLFAKE